MLAGRVVSFDSIFEIAKSLERHPLGGSGLLDRQRAITLHRLVDGDVLVDLRCRDV